MLPRLGEALGRGIKDARQEVAKGLGSEPKEGDGGSTPTA
jgi:hypothetical protein